MKMTYNSKLKRFEVFTTYQEYKAGHVQKVKDARFRFEKEPVPLWYTDNPANASLLISCADEVAKDMLKGRAEARAKALAESRATTADLGDKLGDLGLTPRPFQAAGVAYSLSRKATFFADEPGLGKTLQALASIHLKQTYPCVAIVPATLKINWLKEAVRCVPELREEGAVQILKGQGPSDDYHVMDPKVKLWIVNYDILKDWLFYLQRAGLRSIILDESHFAKNIKAQRTSAAFELATGITIIREKNKRPRRVKVAEPIEDRYLLSGTPEPNRPAELEAQLEILGVLDLFGGTWGFRRRFCDMQEKWVFKPGGKGAMMKVFTYDGATNKDELQRLLREHVMVRRLKKDVLKELPPKQHQCIELAANGMQGLVDEEWDIEDRYNAEVSRLKSEMEVAHNSGNQESFAKAAAELEKRHKAHFQDCAKLAHEVGIRKVPMVIQFCLELLEGNEKLAVFAHHHDVELALEKAFQDAEIETVRLTGMESDKQKDAAITAFQTGSARVFIGGLKCGIGYTITAASRCVMAELDWTPGVMDQASDRLHRIGQLNSVLISYMTLEGSLDSKKVGMLIDKAQVSHEVLDKELNNFDVPPDLADKPKKAVKPELPPTHVLEIEARLGMSADVVPF